MFPYNMCPTTCAKACQLCRTRAMPGFEQRAPRASAGVSRLRCSRNRPFAAGSLGEPDHPLGEPNRPSASAPIPQVGQTNSPRPSARTQARSGEHAAVDRHLGQKRDFPHGSEAGQPRPQRLNSYTNADLTMRERSTSTRPRRASTAGGIRTHTTLRSEAFEASMSTVPSPPRAKRSLSGRRH